MFEYSKKPNPPHSKRAESMPLIVNIVDNAVTIYQVSMVDQYKLPMTIFESAALFQRLLPAWPVTPEQALIVRPIVFTLAGQEQLCGLHLIPVAPQLRSFKNCRPIFMNVREVEYAKR